MYRILISFALLCTYLGYAQKQIEGTQAYLYSIPSEKKTSAIEYISVGEPLSVDKPTVVFLQGALPIPLVLDFETFKHINLPFDYRILTNTYNILVISMPETPVVAKKTELNNQYCYITNPKDQQSFHPDYLKANTLDIYVQRTKSVIQHLKNHHKLTQSLFLVGHSQGAKIATVVTAEDNEVDGVAVLGFNAFGRFDEYIRRVRDAFRNGQLTEEAYLNQLNAHYARWKQIQDDPENMTEGNHTWKSFSIDYSPYLKQIKQPVFIGYGTEDLIADNCDLIPLKLIEGGNTTYTLRPYKNLNHNFFEIKDGKPDRKSGQWTQVMTDALDWLKK